MRDPKPGDTLIVHFDNIVKNYTLLTFNEVEHRWVVEYVVTYPSTGEVIESLTVYFTDSYVRTLKFVNPLKLQMEALFHEV